jgi:signal transduction histidine kinase
MYSLRVPLLGALLLLLAAAVAMALLPAGVSLDRRVSGEIRRVAIEDLGRAPIILDDRNAAQAEALSMHAMTVAMADGLADAVGRDDMERAAELARQTAAMYGEDPVVISPGGEPIVGPPPTEEGLGVLQRDGSWTGYVYHAGVPRAVGLVALASEDTWAGAAGSSTAFDQELASTLAGLARSDVTILGPDGSLVATTLDSATALSMGDAVSSESGTAASETVDEVLVGASPFWVAQGTLPNAGVVLFSRVVADELAALPGVRRSFAFAGLLTLLLALGVGAGVAIQMVRPVRGLAFAADQVAAGDFEAPVPHSRIEEVHRLGGAFQSMRSALKGRIAELADANEALEERQERLVGLQTELIRQDRLASSARMAAELAHEIRNPVANVRNCLEVVRRRLEHDEEGSHFADMAIDELLRMHELAEHLLDLNRPADPTAGDCDVLAVVTQVGDLAGVGESPVEVEIDQEGAESVRVAMPPDALKQVLFNLIDNAGEAAGPGSGVWISIRSSGEVAHVDVLDRGPGIDEEVLPNIFDPFFTTKDVVTGVGLGLFVAEGLVRRYGGRMEAANRTEGPGARFTVEIPVSMGDGA